MYKKKHLEDDDDHEEQSLSTRNSSILENEEKNCEMLFQNTEPYSDEFIIKNIVYKIVNSVEIEQQTSLKNVYYIDNFLSTNNVAYNSQVATSYPQNENKKRKHSSDNVEYLSGVRERDSKKKLLDPIREHFIWCPWLKEIPNDNEFQIANIGPDASDKNQVKNMCQINYEIICKLLLDREHHKENKLIDENPAKKVCLKNSLTILEQVRSAQSILMNCTSQISLK